VGGVSTGTCTQISNERMDENPDLCLPLAHWRTYIGNATNETTGLQLRILSEQCTHYKQAQSTK
jgi:hypothetical protein